MNVSSLSDDELRDLIHTKLRAAQAQAVTSTHTALQNMIVALEAANERIARLEWSVNERVEPPAIGEPEVDERPTLHATPETFGDVLTQAKQMGGAIIILSPGEYTLSEPYTADPSITIQGAVADGERRPASE